MYLLIALVIVALIIAHMFYANMSFFSDFLTGLWKGKCTFCNNLTTSSALLYIGDNVSINEKKIHLVCTCNSTTSYNNSGILTLDLIQFFHFNRIVTGEVTMDKTTSKLVNIQPASAIRIDIVKGVLGITSGKQTMLFYKANVENNN